MTHKLSYTNLGKTQSLVRQGPPDYTKLAAAAFPTPTAAEAGAILENTDTGDRFVWTSTTWIQIVDAGRDQVSYDEFYVEVSKGNVPKHCLVHKFGAIQAVTTALTPLTSSGTYQTPTAPVALEVVSTDNTNDIAAGTGARSVVITGLSNTNGAWTIEEQTIALNGTTVVAVPNSMLRVYRTRVATSGTYASPAAGGASHNSTITVQTAGGGAVWAEIKPEGTFGLGTSEIGMYSVAKGSTAYVLSKFVQVESTKKADILFFAREGADTVAAPFTPMISSEIERNVADRLEVTGLTPLLELTGPADLGFMVKAVSGTADASCDFEVLIVED